MSETEIIKIPDSEDFELRRIFECGQCFRWNADADGVYRGVAKGGAARLWRGEDGCYISCGRGAYDKVWRDYFDLDRDYAAIRKKLSVDDYMTRAAAFGRGIRILRQDRWEALCSFIISQCNNIPRIKKIIETLCTAFGDEIEFEDGKFMTFPPAERVAALSAEDLAPLRSGYRAPYIISAARAVSEGRIDLDSLALTDFDSALRALKALEGVGDKVANCVILFGLQMPDAFPIDVWMKRAIAENYPDGLDPKIFGKNAGLAQQYIFYYARENGR